MRYKQTDEAFNSNINKYGCLFFSLMDIAEEYTGHSFIIRTINKLYYELVDLGIMKEDCYVLDHEKVLQQALECFGAHDKVTYAGADYNSFYTDRKSWGNRNGMFLIMQYKTKNGNGHFRRIFYDSYKPDISLTGLMSIRFYDIGI